MVSHSKPGSVPEFEVNDQTPDSGIRLDQPGSLESEEELMDLETRLTVSFRLRCWKIDRYIEI